MAQSIKVIFPNQGEREAVFIPFEGGSPTTLANAICQSKGWPATQRLRLIAAGRELFDDDTVSPVRTPVIHCIVLSGSSQHSSQGHARQRHSVPCTDWLDVLNPATALVWFFCSLLALSWITLVFYGDLFDGPTLILLSTMTAAFVAPYLLPYIPLPASLRPPCNPTAAAFPPGYTFIDGPEGGRIAVPPRPQAQLRAASSTG